MRSMTEYRRSPHVVYDIKYHFVWCPKYRFAVLEGRLKDRLEVLISEICEMMGVIMVEGEIMKDHVHMCLSVPPKHSPSEVMKRVKGISSERVFKEFPEIKKRYWGCHFWARGYFVSTVGINEDVIKKYIRGQQPEENQIKMWK
jgi:putative transposase